MTKAPTRYDEHCAAVTERILRALEEIPPGGDNWVRPWSAITQLPRNAASGAAYHGSNTLWLSFVAADESYSGWWGTYRQWQNLGRHVNRGETGTRIVKWVPVQRDADSEDPDREARPRLIPRVYSVFALEQTAVDEHAVDPWTPPPPPEPLDATARVEALDDWITSTGAQIRNGGDRAYYRPSSDEIVLPEFANFNSAGDYYAVVLHELVHWTAGGDGARVRRECADRYAEDLTWRAKEELVAELGAAMSCAVIGLEAEPRASHAQYLASWLQVLRDDPKFVVRASSQAAAAVHHLDGLAHIPLSQTLAAAEPHVAVAGLDI